jgi:hypothetical protein
MPNLSANPTVWRREENLLAQARLKAIDAKLDMALREVGASAPPSPPPFTDEDVDEVGRLLVEGRVRLPSHVRVTVTTELTETKSRVFGTTTLYTHTADQLCAHRMRPMSIQAALRAGLVAKLGGSWMWRENVYRQLLATTRPPNKDGGGEIPRRCPSRSHDNLRAP